MEESKSQRLCAAEDIPLVVNSLVQACYGEGWKWRGASILHLCDIYTEDSSIHCLGENTFGFIQLYCTCEVEKKSLEAEIPAMLKLCLLAGCSQ